MDTSLLRPLIGQIRFRSRFTPDVTVKDPFAPGGEAPADQLQTDDAIVNAILTAAKPGFYIDAPGGGQIYAIEPSGSPGDSLWPVLELVGLAVLILAGYGGYKLVGAFRK